MTPASRPSSSTLTERQYTDERIGALKEKNDTTRSLHTVLVTISGGAILISMGFMENIAGDKPIRLWILLTSWILLALAVVSTMVAMYSQQRGAYYYAEELNVVNLYDGRPAESESNNYYSQSRMFTIIAQWLFVLGIAGLMAFSWSNIPGGEANGRHEVNQTSKCAHYAGFTPFASARCDTVGGSGTDDTTKRKR